MAGASGRSGRSFHAATRCFSASLRFSKKPFRCWAVSLGPTPPPRTSHAAELNLWPLISSRSHGSTFGGNPLAVAVANAVLDVVLAPGFLDHVQTISRLFRQKLAQVRDEHADVIDEVRGEGLMLGLKCRVPNMDLVAALFEERMLTVPAATPDPPPYKSKSASTAELAASGSDADRAEYQWRLSTGLSALLLALLVGVFRIVVTHAPDYRQPIVDWASQTLGLPVEIGQVDARLGLFGPELIFRQATILSEPGGDPLFSAGRGSVSLDVMQLLLRSQDFKEGPGREFLRHGRNLSAGLFPYISCLFPNAQGRW